MPEAPKPIAPEAPKPAQAPNQGDFMFGKEAISRNQEDPTYLTRRNQKIIDAMKG